MDEVAQRSFTPSPGSARDLPLSRRVGRALEKAWTRGLLTRPALDPPSLIAKAEEREGRPLAAGEWRRGLDLLSADLAGAAALNPLGQAIAHGLLVKLLRQRIRAERLVERHPEIVAVPLPAPVIILGQMRSGTTRLHRMLACDARFSFTRQHEGMAPLARFRAAAAAGSAAVQALLRACNPALAPIHPGGPFAAEEEFGLHAISFHGAMFEAQWAVPCFSRWDDDRDLRPVYREFGQWLKILRWRRGDGADRRPLLKAPQFLEDLDAVLTACPGARLLRLERDLDIVTASSASLVWQQRRIQSDAADRIAIGAEWRDRTLLRERRAAATLARHPDVPVLHVDYEAMSADWRGEIARVYRFLNLALTPDLEQRMARVASQTSHRRHRYDPEQFGLASSAIGGEYGGRTRART